MATVDLNKVMNKAYHLFLYNQDRKVFLYGGAGAGKSHAIAQKFILRLMMQDYLRFLILRKFQPELKLSVIPLFESYMREWGIPYNYNVSDLTMKVRNGMLIFRGLDRHVKIKSAERIDSIWMEELPEFGREDFMQMNLRMRGISPTYFQLVGSFNPDDRFSWVAEEIDLNRVTHQRFTYKDNQFLDEGYKQELEALQEVDENFYRIYTLGEWGMLRDLIYDNYIIEEEDHPPSWFDALLGGVDYGWNDPSVYLLMGLKDREFYLIDEVCGSHWTNAQFKEQVKEMFHRWRIQYWDVPTWSDHEPDRIEEFNREKFAFFPAIKSPNKRSLGHETGQIDLIKRLKLHIHPRCSNAKKEIRTYKWREIQGRVIDEPVGVRDHSMKSMQYGIFGFCTEYGLVKSKDKLMFEGKSFVGELDWEKETVRG